MRFNTVVYYIKEGLTNVKRNRAMTIASITSVTAALLILGLFLMIILNVDSMADQVESQLQLKAFINDSYDTTKAMEVGDKIKAIDGVKSIKFESKEDALNNFKKQLGDKSYLVNGLQDDNPMPQSFIVQVSDANMMKQISNEIKKIDGVTQVSYGQDVVDKLLGIIKIIRIVGLCVILILFIISVVIISNTIKLGVFSRRREINIMKYIGATDWFIRWPFLVEGIVLGLFGALLSIIVLGLLYGYATDIVNNKLIIFTLLPVGKILRQSLLYFLLMGSVIGALGSGISIKRFLNV
ncbi:permease-like cell division protein FtsX [Thermoanaerobacterium sp. RBIITD]|uniref:permease-like cell division protein FtsX n=1 Tax=Thermoanaerobacterium sp. RBIITD TaxID=1550240 RepID=UPI000BB92C55|nr:permease-like cell division protein FtsX [Thermoanaerobacterium sp. RBIITD]SNX54608.1 cell division transport system permease protein [Thermoanaerobacterium sp. RBIITD]